LPHTCPHCGGSISEIEVAKQFQTEIPRRPIIRQFNVHVGCCCSCGKRIHGRHPLQTSDALGAAGSQIGPDAQAAIAALNKTIGCRTTRLPSCSTSLFGIELTRGASVQIMQRAANRLEPADAEICQEIKTSRHLTPDESGWRVEGKSAWLHAWVVERVVCYAVEQRRKANALENQIGLGWTGTMTHDGFSSYDRFIKATHQQCLRHIIKRTHKSQRSPTSSP
jgi:transposase